MKRRDILVSVGKGAGWWVAGASLGACRTASPEPASPATKEPPPVLEGWLERWLAAFNDPDLRIYRNSSRRTRRRCSRTSTTTWGSARSPEASSCSVRR
ncbi:hypothetical protein [Nannocystis pusilla]|uniref:hypothetical protein n=1 Tax=Nannocystis pusilla TaxID=889268 RepID=UPI003B7C4BBD